MYEEIIDQGSRSRPAMEWKREFNHERNETTLLPDSYILDVFIIPVRCMVSSPARNTPC